MPYFFSIQMFPIVFVVYFLMFFEVIGGDKQCHGGSEKEVIFITEGHQSVDFDQKLKV